jgi:thiamine pyrophosphate-dependent acetolactate synthase large subunit-like protein
MNGGAIIAGMLKQQGVRYLFTLSGGHIAPIYVEAEKAGIRIVDVRHEASAVFAADAVSRLSGVPGVAAVTAGPGVTNTVTALKNAQMAQSPLILFGGATATLLRNRGALQDIDQISIVSSLVKWGTQVKRLRELGSAVSEAFRQARHGVPGPVFLEVPVDLLYDEATVREWYGQKNDPGRTLAAKLRHWYIKRHVNRLFGGVQTTSPKPPAQPRRPRFESDDITRSIRALRSAERPVMVLGSGAMTAPEQAIELAAALRSLGVPLYLSGMARGLLGPADPLQCLHQRKKALREADCIVLAGVPADFRLDYGRQLNKKARLIVLNCDKTDLRRNMPRSWMTEQTDPAHFLIELAHKAGELPAWTDWKARLAGYQALREAEIEQMAAEPLDGINPVALCRTLERLLPNNSVLVADGGDFAATASYTLRPRKPLGWLDPGAFGTLGVGGGFALGAALHYPDDYIWIIYGDGSAAFSMMEFDGFARNKLKVCAIIGNNGSWEQIARDQAPMLGSRTATDLALSDYHRVAEAFGGAGERVESLGDFENAVRRAVASMDSGIPYAINAVIGKSEFRKGSISM